MYMSDEAMRLIYIICFVVLLLILAALLLKICIHVNSPARYASY